MSDRPSGAAWSWRWRVAAAVLGVAAAAGGTTGAAAAAAGRGEAVRPALSLDSEGPTCPDWGCGMNHNQVLL